jgi:hypothetical protein
MLLKHSASTYSEDCRCLFGLKPSPNMCTSWMLTPGMEDAHATDPHPRIEGVVNSDRLEQLWKGAYDARSRFVHEGRREITLANEMMLRAKSCEAQRLSLANLRAATRHVIQLEIDSRCDPGFQIAYTPHSKLWTPTAQW